MSWLLLFCMALRRPRSWGLRLPSALIRPSAPLIRPCSSCKRLASLRGQLPGSQSLLDSVLLALLTPVYPPTWRRQQGTPGLLGEPAGLVVDFGVAGISVGLGLIIGLNRLGIAPAAPGS